MFVISAVVSIVLAVSSAASGTAKLVGVKQLLTVRDRLGVPSRVWALIGLLEIAAAVGLVAGTWALPLGIAAAAGLVLLMIGALAAHARVHDPSKEMMPAVFTLLLAVASLTLRLLAS
jgi:DoxX-like family